MYTTTSSGLQYYDVHVGRGAKPTAGDQVSVHYSGTLTDGTLFDSSRDFQTPVDERTAAPLSFRVGMGLVIAGWDEGILSMRVGGRRKLVVPPELGYGSSGAGAAIGPNATLLFECELCEIKEDSAVVNSIRSVLQKIGLF
jgi:peptidylprolyl isomerase